MRDASVRNAGRMTITMWPIAGWNCWVPGVKPLLRIMGRTGCLITAIRGQKPDWRMKMCVGPFAPKMPKMAPLPPPPEPPEPPPTRDDPAVNAAAAAERRRRLSMKGRSSTILTGSMGDETEANIGKTLLGG